MEQKFGLSQSVLRREDPRLLTGQGVFVEDHNAPGQLHGVMLRSPHAHARLTRLDVGAARAAPGARLILTGKDLNAQGIKPIAVLAVPKPRAGSTYIEHGHPVLITDRACFVGDGVAWVVADTPEQAADAAAMIEVDWDVLPAAVDCAAAMQPGAAQLWPDAPNNICFEWELGDAKAVEVALAKAARVVHLEVRNNRIVQNPIETRGCLALYDAGADKLTLHTGSQMPHPMKNQLVALLGIKPEQIRVLIGDVGGGFGGKNSLYPEQALALLSAKALRRPVKWMSSRAEAFISDYHGRDNLNRGWMAFDAENRILGLKIHNICDLGAYVAARGPTSPTSGTVMASNTYRIPAIHVAVTTVFTNTVPTDPYRGAGRPELLHLIERLIDHAARELGVDRVELRRRNCIPPDAFPYKTPTGLSYDSADFQPVIDAALARADWPGFAARRDVAAKHGRLRGIGMANYIERCGGGAGLGETGRLEFAADGSVTVYSGSQSNGQAHETAFSQIVHHWLGIPFEKIRVVEGDTDRIATGTGTGGSWSIPMGGGSIALAAEKVLDKTKRIAAHLLEAAPVDIAFEAGQFSIAGTDRRISFERVVAACFDPARLPSGETPGLDESARHVPDNYTFPYGVHVAEVEIDRDTGAVQLVGYVAVHDFGRALNPMLLAGQVHGGVTQGIGQALFEHTAYGADGQLLAGSYMDYCLPRADDLPAFVFDHRDTPTTRNLLGVTGCGEAGATGSPPAVMNAVMDALAPLGVKHVDMPATAEKVWRAINGG
jgi:aerobic carbon-monoxide dehydrogenase large subunit